MKKIITSIFLFSMFISINGQKLQVAETGVMLTLNHGANSGVRNITEGCIMYI